MKSDGEDPDLMFSPCQNLAGFKPYAALRVIYTLVNNPNTVSASLSNSR
jgi:hypothetical protein